MQEETNLDQATFQLKVTAKGGIANFAADLTDPTTPSKLAWVY